MAGGALSSQSLVGHLGDVGSSHHDRHTSSAYGIGHAIRFCDHPGHGADTHQSNILLTDVSRNASLIHGLSVAINQQNFVTSGCQGLEEEHPKVRHEVAGYTVVR